MERHSPLDEMRAAARLRAARAATTGQTTAATAMRRRKERRCWRCRARSVSGARAWTGARRRYCKALLESCARDPAFDVRWCRWRCTGAGRRSASHMSWLRLLLSEDWALAQPRAPCLTVLFNGRNTVVRVRARRVAASLAGRPAAPTTRPHAHRAPPAAQLAASRTAYVGPDLSHRRTLMTEVLRARSRAHAGRAGGARQEHSRRAGDAEAPAKCSRRSPPTIRTSSCA